MTQRYIDISFDESCPSNFGGYDNENNATVIRLKTLDETAQYYIEVEYKSNKYSTPELMPVDGYVTFELSREFTQASYNALYVQGIMKLGDETRKTARVRVNFSRSINAVDGLPESSRSWADDIEAKLNTAVLYAGQELTDEQQAQARSNIGAADVSLGATPVDIGVTLFGKRAENIVYVREGWLKPCPEDADKETITNYVVAIIAPLSLQQSNNPDWSNPTKYSKAIYALYQKGLADSKAKVMYSTLNSERYISWSISSSGSKNTVQFTQKLADYYYYGVYSVENDKLTWGSFEQAVKQTANTSGDGTCNIKQQYMSADPTADMHIATKHYVDNSLVEATATDDDILTTLYEAELITPMAQDGTIYTDADGAVLLI